MQKNEICDKSLCTYKCLGVGGTIGQGGIILRASKAPHARWRLNAVRINSFIRAWDVCAVAGLHFPSFMHPMVRQCNNVAAIYLIVMILAEGSWCVSVDRIATE